MEEKASISSKEIANKKNNCNNDDKFQKDINSKNILFSKDNIIIIVFSLLIILGLFYLNKKYTLSVENYEKLEQKIEQLESKIINLTTININRKLRIGIVFQSFYGNGISRYLTVLSELLAKTEKYDVFLICEEITNLDFPQYRKVKKIIQKKDPTEIATFDKNFNIDIYILNNEASTYLETYNSLGKKIIGIFHGVFLSCIFTNNTSVYQQWYRFNFYDAFVQIIPDDYYIYKKFNFENEVFIPNLYTFEPSETPESPLTKKNALIVGRIDDIIKGARYGIRAFAEALKYEPDATLNIVSQVFPQSIINLVQKLGILSKVNFLPYTQNISEAYLNSSVLIVSSLSESFPMVMNEAKAHGIPIVAFNVDYSPCYQKGVMTVDMFDYKSMGELIAKLLKDKKFRKKKGIEAKKSLEMFKNNETIGQWDKLFQSLMKGKDEYKKFQKKVEDKYYNETLAKARIKKHYKYAQMFNSIVSCHSFEQFTDINYLKNLKDCPINN